MKPLVKTARGALAVARQRGVGYVGYLLGGVAWPRAAYRFGWGPSAPALMQGVLAAARELAAGKPDPAELRRLGLLAPHGEGAAVGRGDPREVESLMDRAHAAGITGVARSFSRLVRMPDNSLRFADLAAARKHRPEGVHFLASRDEDRRAFNRIFGASLLTEASARQALTEMKANIAVEGDYPPLDFGCGLTVGDVAAGDSAAQSQAFYHRIVAPIVAGKRVLDLGSNIGSLPMLMLRAGAREVVAVELAPEKADFARLGARLLAWRDVRPYEIDVRTGDMRIFLTNELGTFDVVTAFCSLYYLPEDDMARIIHKAASMDAVLILQANEEIDTLPARTLDLHRLMRENGYAEVSVHTPAGFARPLLVGYTDLAAGARYRESPLRA